MFVPPGEKKIQIEILKSNLEVVFEEKSGISSLWIQLVKNPIGRSWPTNNENTSVFDNILD